MAMGLLYAAGAVFNAVYTMRHHEEFYGSFVDGAWLSPARSFVRNVVLPNGTLFTVVLIVFQVGVAAVLLTRSDWVVPALFAGAAFALVAAFASSPGGTVGNLALAAAQIGLAVTR
jgi:hypothetical protein